MKKPRLPSFDIVQAGGSFKTFRVDGTVIYQTAVFKPAGLSGLLYWYALLPVHALIFGGLLRAFGRRARSRS